MRKSAVAVALAQAGLKPTPRKRLKRFAPKHSHSGSTVPNQRFALNNWALAA